MKLNIKKQLYDPSLFWITFKYYVFIQKLPFKSVNGFNGYSTIYKIDWIDMIYIDKQLPR